MKNHRFDKYIYAGVTAIAVIAAAICLIFGFLEREAVWNAGRTLVTIMMPIIYGAVLAFLLAPVYNLGFRMTMKAWKGKNEKMARGIAKTVGTIASAAFLFAVAASLFQMVIPQIYATIVGIVNTMPVYIQNLQNWITEVFANNPPLEETVLSLYQQLVFAFQNWTSENLIPNLQSVENLKNLEIILGGVSSGVVGVYKLVSNTLIGLIVMVYLLNIKDTLTAQSKKIIYAFLPLKAANGTVDEFRYIHKVFSGFIIGKLIDSLIIGILCFFLMKLFKLPFELLISVIVGVTNVIPFFGPFIGAIPSAILIFLISPMQCLYFIFLILALQQFDGNILGPKILGDTTGISSFWVLFSILVFGGLLGFVGMIIAVPMTAVIFDLFSKIQYKFLRKKELSPDTRDYLSLQRIDEDSKKFIRHD